MALIAACCCRRCVCQTGPGIYGFCEVVLLGIRGQPVQVKVGSLASAFLSRQVWQDCRTVISFMMGALICHCTRCSKGGTVGARLKRFEFVVA